MNAGRPKKKIVTMGGGTGTFTVLSALRTLPGLALTAIVSSADDGGSTGRLRDAYGILPPGDARQALVALAEEDTMLRALFTHRFSKGDVAGHNLGNLFLTALAEILGSVPLGIEEASRILRVDGRVLCISDQPGVLEATLNDGTVLRGEHAIDAREKRAPIQTLSLAEKTRIATSARKALHDADLVIFGPGDLYTSTIATLLPSGVSDALGETKARLVYIMNLFTKLGQTNGLSSAEHVREVERYVGRPLDHVIISTDGFPKEALERYAAEGEAPIVDDMEDDPRIIRRDLASVSMVEPVPEDPVPRSLIRHDPVKLATALKRLV